VIAFVSKSEADCRTLREVAGRVSQSVVSCADMQEARRAIRWHAPKIVVCETQVRESGNWQELLEEAQAAQSLMLVVSRHADERLWAEVLNLGGFDVADQAGVEQEFG
jgi:DNA-binding NtrC family response regulator